MDQDMQINDSNVDANYLSSKSFESALLPQSREITAFCNEHTIQSLRARIDGKHKQIPKRN